MREYTSKVDKLEEAEKLRAEEVKEENNKPIVMGEFPNQNMLTIVKNTQEDGRQKTAADHGLGVHVALAVNVLVTAR